MSHIRQSKQLPHRRLLVGRSCSAARLGRRHDHGIAAGQATAMLAFTRQRSCGLDSGWRLPGSSGHVLHRLIDIPASEFDVLEIQPTPDDAVVADPEDRDPTHFQSRAIHSGALPMPLGPTGVVLARRPDQIGVEVGDVGEDLRPVRADLRAAEEGWIRMQGLLAAVLRVKASDEGVHSRRSPAPQELRPNYSSWRIVSCAHRGCRWDDNVVSGECPPAHHRVACVASKVTKSARADGGV
jgi:hypothetical protein